MKEVYGNDVPSYNDVKHWLRQFSCAWTLVETAPIPGRPRSALNDDTTHKVEAAILEDRRIRQLTQEVKISVRSVEKIIHDDLAVRKLSARWILRMLTSFQKQE
ncbi:uncharacterized protein LOC106871999 [Octopus bimaculoides]|uniref:uncharacterized protein LOC106871999 n=1 Tax=Octopus bimaculoides TaxID=37653 RepID=UPI00071C8633|nr:uncharacterized protein LOC106871999 [Octopus bimaculoides]|eukprot:XP_014774282.1 PREDICTED: uncharacterized protein LOC106871999 [Octopus bimaculoides]